MKIKNEKEVLQAFCDKDDELCPVLNNPFLCEPIGEVRAGGIETLGDLCKLRKTDWLRFRNGGKKSLIEIDGLLHDHGLDWAE